MRHETRPMDHGRAKLGSQGAGNQPRPRLEATAIYSHDNKKEQPPPSLFLDAWLGYWRGGDGGTAAPHEALHQVERLGLHAERNGLLADAQLGVQGHDHAFHHLQILKKKAREKVKP